MIYAKGSEAYLYLEEFFGIKTLIKKREKKGYINKALRLKLSKQRNKQEIKLLHKAKPEINCPFVLEFGDTWFRMTFIDGKKPKASETLAAFIGKSLALLHKKGIIHGDLTPANVLLSNNTFFIIDFGLGFFSNRIEDFADDLIVSIYALSNYKEDLLSAYIDNSGKKEVIKRVNKILGRVRYAKGKLFN